MKTCNLQVRRDEALLNMEDDDIANCLTSKLWWFGSWRTGTNIAEESLCDNNPAHNNRGVHGNVTHCQPSLITHCCQLFLCCWTTAVIFIILIQLCHLAGCMFWLNLLLLMKLLKIAIAVYVEKLQRDVVYSSAPARYWNLVMNDKNVFACTRLYLSNLVGAMKVSNFNFSLKKKEKRRKYCIVYLF